MSSSYSVQYSGSEVVQTEDMETPLQLHSDPYMLSFHNDHALP